MRKRVYISAVLFAVLAVAGFLFRYRPSAERMENRYENLQEQDSAVLREALNYVSAQPMYQSRYYAGGYPDDGCGTCVDVVGIALRECGYDLMREVSKDVNERREAYDIETADANIDFRRVRNLKVFFAKHAQVLTTDLSLIHEWQGGDIVIFDNHIGIVTDRRNSNGIPYVIHHNSRFQRRYEEDILTKRKDICLHVRMRNADLKN